ncbi:TetR/AcrR family transcriptional regulator [Patulibacter sp.]|uniref:TetR/AcrR family transcriptional regulator n=1 Tax=Patulibacter sp. TaxID=1912859 RepID=UPI00271A2641|nr:TetR/AcrR family transcriptional regulator [Patulibacter sp.]MDO9407978.1 TetR/AcrR family transcriptional regulator [Patulibacter sp.]
MPSVARRGKNGRARRGTVEQHVFEAVERLLAGGETYTALGIQRIADEAGIARSSFYLNFADKSDLLIRLADAATGDLFGVAEERLSSPEALTPEALRETFLSVVAEYRRNASALGALNEVAAYDAGVASFWRVRVEAFGDALRDRLRLDLAAGRVAPDLDVDFTAHWIVWGSERSVAQHVAAGATDDDRLATAVARSVWWTMYGGA